MKVFSHVVLSDITCKRTEIKSIDFLLLIDQNDWAEVDPLVGLSPNLLHLIAMITQAVVRKDYEMTTFKELLTGLNIMMQCAPKAADPRPETIQLVQLVGKAYHLGAKIYLQVRLGW